METATGDGGTSGLDPMVLSVLTTEAWLESMGWDALPTVMVLVRHSGDELEYSVVGEGDPYEILQTIDADDALALLVAAELWAWPPDLPEDQRIGRPSEHLDRVEVRSVTALTRSGLTIGVVRPRGGKPIVETTCSGPLVDAMAAALTTEFPWAEIPSWFRG